MERDEQKFPKRITIEDWLIHAHPDAPGLPWTSDAGDEICSFVLWPLGETGGIAVILFDAYGREVIMTGPRVAVEQTVVALGAVPRELTFLPAPIRVQRQPN